MSRLRAGRRRVERGWLDPSLRDWLGFAPYEAAQLVRAESDGRLAVDAGLSWNEVAALTVLDAIGRELPPAAVRERTGIDRTTLGLVLRGLEEDDLVQCAVDPFDGRRVSAVITAAGAEALAAARAALAAAERRTLRRLSTEERERLHRLTAQALPPQPHPLARLFAAGR